MSPYSTITTPDQCPFCLIVHNTPPSRDPPPSASPRHTTHVVLSTPAVVAFLDIAPVTPGHVVLVPRKHEEMITQYKSEETAVMGFWLPIVSRGVMRGVFGGEIGGNGKGAEGRGWDVVNANGTAAGQTVPHTHFHIIPRPGNIGTALDAERRHLASQQERGKLEDKDAEKIREAIKSSIREEVDRLRTNGEIVDGREVYEYWGNVEGRRGLWL